MEPPVLAAIVTASVALLLGLLNFARELKTAATARRHQEDLQRLSSELAEQKAEQDARRAYEYDARKRLYTETEPLLFQLMELAEAAQGRIYGLARTARSGDLDPLTGWLSTDSYYLQTTVYTAFAPMVVFRALRSRLTTLDLQLDPRIHAIYLVGKALYYTWAEDYDIAATPPVLDYDPNSDDPAPQKEGPANPYRRQGMPRQVLEKTVEAMTVTAADGTPRGCVSFGGFERLLGSNDGSSETLKRTLSIFNSFHPLTCPVLWRILVTQAYLYKILLTVPPDKLKVDDLAGLMLPSDLQALDWRHDLTPTDEEIETPYRVAQAHLSDALQPLWAFNASANRAG